MPVTAEQNKEITTYILRAVLGFEEATAKAITDTKKINQPSRLNNATQRILDKWEADGVIEDIEIEQIKTFQEWFKAKRAKDELPVTLDEWKAELPAGEAIGVVEDDAASSTQQDPITPAVIKSDSKPKISDYPSLSPVKDTSWYAGKIQFESIAELGGFSDLLEVEDEDVHKQRCANDTVYQKKSEQLYNILVVKTADGTALTHVLKFKATKDGALAWKYLKEYYDHEGNKNLYAQDCLKELLSMKLQHDSAGGMEKYISNFELCVLKIEQATPDQAINEDTKKTYFLQGIEDTEYAGYKDFCEAKNWMETIAYMRQKAKELGKANGPVRRIRKYNNARRSEESRNNAQEDPYWLPQEVWAQMSLESKRQWNQMKKNKTPTSSSGGQYDNKQKEGDSDKKEQAQEEQEQGEQSSTRKSNNVKTDDPEEEKTGGPTHKSLFRKINMMKTNHGTRDSKMERSAMENAIKTEPLASSPEEWGSTAYESENMKIKAIKPNGWIKMFPRGPDEDNPSIVSTDNDEETVKVEMNKGALPEEMEEIEPIKPDTIISNGSITLADVLSSTLDAKPAKHETHASFMEKEEEYPLEDDDMRATEEYYEEEEEAWLERDLNEKTIRVSEYENTYAQLNKWMKATENIETWKAYPVERKTQGELQNSEFRIPFEVNLGTNE